MAQNSTVVETKYRLFWGFATLISFILYFTGIVALYFFWRRRTNRYIVKVITYHQINDDRNNLSITVSRGNFEKQIKFIKKKFSVVSISEVVNYVKDESIIFNHDTVAITFDDGYMDNFTNAFQVLRSYSLPATIFLVSNAVGSEGMLNLPEIREMLKNEIAFGSHTVTHPILTEISTQDSENEIKNSKVAIEKILNTKVEFFAYPKGKRKNFNEIIKTLIKNAGYLAALTTENKEVRKNDDLFEMGRIGIRNCPMFVFKTRMSGIFESNLCLFFRNLLKMT
jgi:peptidoglycan/xylan/chitin deacetylase (PgdA/CDA1 family)